MSADEAIPIDEHADWRQNDLRRVLARWQRLLGPGEVLRRWAPGTVMLLHEEARKKAYLVKKGVIVLTHELDNGRQAFINLRRPGQLFGHDDMFLNYGFHLSACALTEVVVQVIDSRWLFDQIRQGGEAGLLLSRQHDRDLAELAAEFSNVMHVDASERFQRLLMRIADVTHSESKKDFSVDLPLTDGRIASLLGISAQQFSAVKRKLRKTNKVLYLKDKRAWFVYSTAAAEDRA